MLIFLSSITTLYGSWKHSKSISLCQLFKDAIATVNSGLTAAEREQQTALQRQRKVLEQLMAEAITWQEWTSAVSALDKLDRNDMWRQELRDPELEHRTELINDVRTSGSIQEMARATRTFLDRDLGIMGDVNTYDRALVDSPYIIKQYVYSACHLISELAAHPDITGDQQIELLELFEDAIAARQSFGRSALFLSGGATFGMAHIGVVKAMWEHGVLPKVITGASAGSIICSIVCTRTDKEIPNLLRTFHEGNLAVFDSTTSPTSFLGRLWRLATDKTWADSGHLRRVMEGFLGDITFLEAYHKTRRICNITVSSPDRFDHQRLLNYVTAPNVTIASAVTASCSVPFFFEPTSILSKDPLTQKLEEWNMTSETYIDGSVHSDLPMEPIGEMFNVNHFIVSQANPHVTPALDEDNNRKPTPLSTTAQQEAHERLEFVLETDVLPHNLSTLITKGTSITSQIYTGDITAIPQMDFSDYFKLLSNPTPAFMQKACLRGERAVWPKLQRIKDRMAIEQAIDFGLEVLRERLAFHPKFGESRRELMLTDMPIPRPRRNSGGSVGLLADGPKPLTTTGPSKLKRGSYSQHFALLPIVKRARRQNLPPLQHPDTFRREILGIDFSRPLSPTDTVTSNADSPVSPDPDPYEDTTDVLFMSMRPGRRLSVPVAFTGGLPQQRRRLINDGDEEDVDDREKRAAD